MNILADAQLPGLARCFPPPFRLTYYANLTELHERLPDHTILLCRSTLKINAQLGLPSSIQCVATASSGIDHVDTDFIKKRQITLFDAKGANAQAVTDYVMACLKQVQHHLKGMRAGIVGAGCVGSRVGQRLQQAGFDVVYVDPLKAMLDTSFCSGTLDDLRACDVVCIHANLHHTPPFPSVNLINQSVLSTLKPDVVLINAARGGLVDEQALLNTPESLLYCTDVYQNEPHLNAALIQRATLCTPHIAGHSIEAKQRAVIQLSQQLHQHYQVPMPHYPSLTPPMTNTETDYDPSLETQQLKNALDLPQAFLDLRRAHVHRHEILFDK